MSKLDTVNNDILLHRHDELMNQVDKDGKVDLTKDELSELVEIEHELTVREG
jgi:DNA primase large subunit